MSLQRLQHLSWDDAAKQLQRHTVVVIPLGAALKEHGLHLPLDTDLRIAEWLTDHLPAMSDVVATPTVNYFHYPAFVAYPGSTSIGSETSAAYICDIVRSLARHGPRCFYVLNTGVSTMRVLARASETLAPSGILLQWTNIETIAADTEAQLSEQVAGSHADELETSMLLAIAPQLVNMRKARVDLATGQGTFSPVPMEGTRYSPTGAFGNPTLATRNKGELILRAWLDGIQRDIAALLAVATRDR